jgi:hypothetical protein
MTRTTGTSTATSTVRSSGRSTTRPLALAALGVALLAIAGGGVRATLSAIADGDAPMTIASGTLLLELDDDGAGLTTPITDLAPGDTVDRFVDLANTGTLDTDDLHVELDASGDTVLLVDGTAPATTRALTLTIDACDGPWDTATSTCSGDVTSLLGSTTLGALDGASTPLPLALAADDVAHLRLRFLLPDQDETSTNGVLPTPTIQDATASVDVTFRVEQRDARTTAG